MLVGTPSAPRAHEVPATVTILAFAKPDSQRFGLLLRVPLGSMRDFDFPLRAGTYLDIAAADSLLRDAARLWLADYMDVHENEGERLTARLAALRISLPSDRSFASYESALASVVSPPLPAGTDIPWQQALLDVLFEYEIASDTSAFSIAPRLAWLGGRTTTVLRFLPPSGAERIYQYQGDPGVIRLDPRWHQAAFRFVRLGFEHILDGIDHLLFVLCLVIPVRRARPLIAIVTAFTAAHSVTLIASALGLAPDALWFPPLVETLIAASIVYMAFENIVGARLEHRWKFAFAFGLVHGFGFSFALRESMQFAGRHVIGSLLAFNVGVELGQVLVVAIAVPLLTLLYKHVVKERMGTILLSALVAHTAWHWMTERGTTLREYRFEWPVFDLAFAAGLVRAVMLLLIIGAAAWLLMGLARWARAEGVPTAEPEPRQ